MPSRYPQIGVEALVSKYETTGAESSSPLSKIPWRLSKSGLLSPLYFFFLVCSAWLLIQA